MLAWAGFIYVETGRVSMGRSGHDLGHNLYIRAQRMEAQPAAARQAGNGRIIFRIQPKDEAGNPCASPGAEKKQ